MRFQPGQSGNPKGGKKGNYRGREGAMRLLDMIIGKKKCTEALAKALEDNLREKPLEFFKTIIMPLVPKNAKAPGPVNDGIIEWKSLVSVSARVIAEARAAGKIPPGSGQAITLPPAAPHGAVDLPKLSAPDSSATGRRSN